MKSKWWLIALVACLALVFLAPLASSAPDGLERVAEDVGFMELAQEAPFSLIADYIFPGLENNALATILAGIVGTLVLFGIAYALAWRLVSRRRETV